MQPFNTNRAYKLEKLLILLKLDNNHHGPLLKQILVWESIDKSRHQTMQQGFKGQVVIPIRTISIKRLRTKIR